MKKRMSFFVSAGLLAGACAGPSPAQDKDRAGGDQSREADREAIRKFSREFVQAFEKGDAKALASQWTDNAEYNDDSGVVLRGRDQIERAYAELFKEQPKRKIDVEIRSIRFPSRDAAIEEGILRVNPPGSEMPATSRYSALHVREDGVWRIAVSREWGAADEKLDDLAWLVGDWAATSKDREVRLSFAWNDRKTFLHNRFTVSDAGKVTSSGTQEIGEDPRTGQLRSWMFDDDGSRGEVLWFRDGHRWILESSGVTANGIETSATNVVTRVDDDKFTWRSINRTIAGESVPDTPAITVTRMKSGGAGASPAGNR
jgi:uncharacterized protein (TIGR02246 family)